MNSLGLRTKLLLSFAIFFLVLFIAGESDAGQRFLRGSSSDNASASEDQPGNHGFLPLVYCAVPSAVLLLLSLGSYRADRHRME